MSGDGEKTFISDVDFEHFYRVNQQVLEVTFQDEININMVQTRNRYFQYRNYSKEIDVGLYGFPYCLGSLITNSNVGEFPDYLRELSRFNRVFSECSSLGSSGIYDMEEQRRLFEGLRMADLGNIAIENKEVKDYVNRLLDNNSEHDKRFAYNLLGATGICIVPLTSFFTNLLGFRMTLLEKDVEKFERNVKIIAQKIVEYIESAK